MGGKNGIVLPALHHVYVEEVQLAQGPLYRSGRAGGAGSHCVSGEVSTDAALRRLGRRGASNWTDATKT